MSTGATQGARVSVIVLNYNGAHLLPQCLDSLLRQDYPQVEILLVDNGSIDESLEVAARLRIPCLALGEDTGLARGFNAGAGKVQGKYLFFASHDMRFESDCVRRLTEALEADPSAFAADPLQYDWSGERIVHYRTVLRVPRTVRELVFHTTLHWPPRVRSFAPASDVVEIPWGCAGSILVRRELFEALGGFDPHFFLDFEDLDLCWRAWRHGWKTCFVPAARLFHRVAATTDTILANDRPDLIGRIARSDMRRIMSQQYNHQRFVLKTMGPMAIVMFHAMKSIALAGYVATGRWRAAVGILRAWGGNFRDIREIWAARRTLETATRLGDQELFRRFGTYTGTTLNIWPATALEETT